jgi:hypothetical protein
LIRLRPISWRVLALCAACALFHAPARAEENTAASPEDIPEKIQLRLHLEKGQVYDQVMALAQKTSQSIANRKYDVSMTMRFEIANEVLEVQDDGVMLVRSTYRRVQFSMDAPRTGPNPVPANLPFRYDSAHPPKVLPPSAAGAAALAGQSVVTTFSPEGGTLKVEGVEKLVERILDFTKTPAAARANLRKTLQSSMSEQTQKTMSGVARFPDRAVGVGDSWQSELSNLSSLPIALSTQYSLLARSGGVAHIGMVSKISPNEKGSAQKVANIQIKYSISGSQSGVLSVDEATGWTQSFEVRQRFSGKITTTPAGGKPQSWPIWISSTVRGWTLAPVKQ